MGVGGYKLVKVEVQSQRKVFEYSAVSLSESCSSRKKQARHSGVNILQEVSKSLCLTQPHAYCPHSNLISHGLYRVSQMQQVEEEQTRLTKNLLCVWW
jgi:hypothetical protein